MNKNHGPWVILKSVKKYKNRWVEVIEDKVIRPDGKRGIFGRVNMKSGVSVLPVDSQGFVYLTKEFHYAIGRESIEAVSGGIDKKETPLKAAKRELKEELGITAKKWVSLGKVDPFTTVIDSPAFLFLARNLRHYNKTNQEGTEILETIKVKLTQALKMAMDSKITHGPSCALILKADRYFKNKL